MNKVLLAVALATGLVSCADDSNRVEDEMVEDNEQGEVGGLTLNLTGYDSQGRQYRLRDAEFYVSSYGYNNCYYYGCDAGTNVSKVLSTELDPNAPTLTTTLVPGTYTVDLQDGWYIERLTPTGPERVERAVLLSDRVQYSWIYHGGVSYLAFRFGIDGELVDFRHGDLVIGSEFELPGESQPDAGWWPSYDAGAIVRSDAGMAQF